METRCTLCQEAEPFLWIAVVVDNKPWILYRDARRRRDRMELYIVIRFDDTCMVRVIFSIVVVKDVVKDVVKE
jgi:hypothetical protein